MEELKVDESLTIYPTASLMLFGGMTLTLTGGFTTWSIFAVGLRWDVFGLIEPPLDSLPALLALASGLILLALGWHLLRAFWGDWPSLRIGPNGVQFCMVMGSAIPWSSIRRVEHHVVRRVAPTTLRNVLILHVDETAKVPFRNLLWRLLWSPVGGPARYVLKIPKGHMGEELLRIVQLHSAIHTP